MKKKNKLCKDNNCHLFSPDYILDDILNEINQIIKINN